MAQLDVTMHTGDLERLLGHFSLRSRSIDMADAAEEMALAVDDLIQSEGTKGPQGFWEPLAASTLRRHPRRVGGMLLQATGQLANVQKFSGAKFAEVRSPAPYAGFHVTGTKHMPRRDFLAIDFEQVLEKIGVQFTEHVTR